MKREKETILMWVLTLLFGFLIGFSLRVAKPEIIRVEVPVEVQAEEIKSELVSLGYFEATAYCDCMECCGKTDGITSSGKKATAKHTIAADTSILPFNTEVYIDGQKYTVEDTGGTIKGKKIDIYFEDHNEALNFGRKQLEVFIKGA